MELVRFGVRRVRLRQFRSIGACDVTLGDLTILVGPNGAGKSNFLDGFRLTAQALNENLDNALRERGGVSEVRRKSTGHPTHFAVSFEFEAPGLNGSYGYQVGAVKGGDYRVTHEDCRVVPHAMGVPASFYKIREGKVVGTSEPLVPVAADDRLFLVAAAGLEVFRPVFDGLSAMNVYNLNPESMRQPQAPDPGDLLRRDASNIASVLERLKRERPAVKDRIEDYLRNVVPDIVSAERRGLGSWESLEMKQRVEGASAPWTFAATSMSDGTLRALGALVALFAGPTRVMAPIGIEEPEAALHPAAAGTLLEALRDASSIRQVLATSHSPDLLDSDAIGSRELLAVHSSGGSTAVDRIDSAGAQALLESLYTAGELLRVDQIRPAQRMKPEQLDLFAS